MKKYGILGLLILVFGAAFANENGLERLMEGNKRYVQDQLEHPNRTSESRQAYLSTQEPFAVVVGCSDSRVAPEIIFDQGVGDIFVVRVAGNVVGPLELESIEYAARDLQSSVILVLGHQNCGAVDAVVNGQTQNIKSIAKLIEPTVKKIRQEQSKNLLELSIKANALKMKQLIIQSPAIQKRIQDHQLEVHAGYYHLHTGVVELL